MNNVTPELLMNNILGKISDVLLNGDGKVIPKSDDHYLAFLSVGVPMLEETFNYAIEGFGGIMRQNSNIDKLSESVGPEKTTPDDTLIPGTISEAADARRKYQSAEAFFALCDLVPDTSGIVDSNRINTWNPETRVSHAYSLALQFSQVYDREPDEETKRKIDRWRSLLNTTKIETDITTEEKIEVTRESKLVKKYREKMLAYTAAALEYNILRISALSGEDENAVHQFAINGATLQMKLNALENDWISNGFRDDYDKINAALSSVEGRSFALLKQRYKQDYLRSVLTSPNSGANFLYTAPIPADFAHSDSGWTKFYFNSGSFKSNHKFSKSTSSISGGGMFIAAFGGSGNVKETKSATKIDTEKFSMSFQMCRVPIYRPSINLSFLKSGFWRFLPNDTVHKNSMISDGKSPPDGIMPAITTDCIFIKNLELDFGESHTKIKNEFKSKGGSAGIHWGAFNLGGSHKNNIGDTNSSRDWNEGKISIDGMQLIGFMCHTLDKSPNPNPDIKDDEWI